MIQVYADGVLTYDSRLEEYDLTGLKVTRGLNKGGTAEITMPHGHPAYSTYRNYRTVVEVYRDGRLKFRGRALYPVDNYANQRTIVCEGELCFLQDAIHRPYLHTADPAAIFTELIGDYNSQVESFKRFKVGTITVTDPNNYIRLESESAEPVLAVVQKLQERCGGYIVFTTDSVGARVINWLASVGQRSTQAIELGENLFDFSRSGANTDMATGILPYGAKYGTAGRVTIESVNGGKDYIIDETAASLRGTIIKTVVYDDITDPTNLLARAQADLDRYKLIVTSLELTALDLSYLDKTIDSYEVGDLIPVRSKPHGLDEYFQLVDQAENLLDPSDGLLTLGKEVRTLTSQDVAGDQKSLSEINKISNQMTSDYTANVSVAIQASEQTMLSLIQQTSTAIMLEVSQTYTTNDRLVEAISSSMTQLENKFLFEFNTLRATVDANDAAVEGRFTEIYNYISFENGDIKLGGSDSPITLTLEKDKIVFKKNGQPYGWWDGTDFHTGNIVVEVNERAQFGNFAFVPRSDGSLSFLKVGG